MKKRKWLMLAGITSTAAFLLAACGSSTNSSNTYSYVYVNEPNTLDYIQTNRATTSDVVGNLVDGLLGNDQYGNFTPALAKEWTVSQDGLTYTYKLREDAKWYTADGEEYANVTAKDFVTGIKHAVDSKSEALYLIQNSIKGLDDYVTGKTTDFSTVGVKAVDDYTVEYTLTRPESYWNSKTTSTILFPVNEEFLKAKGDDFGKVEPNGILYNGPYLLKSLTSKSTIEYAKNQNYYDKDNVHIEQVKLSYFDGSDQEALVRNFEDGAYTVATVYPNSSTYAKVAEKYKDNIIYSQQDGTSFFYHLNFNRESYNYTGKTTDEQKNATKQAVLNRNFRVAVNYAIDRTAYSAQTNGQEAANNTIRNTFVPPTFVQIGEKNYGQVISDKLVTANSEWSGIDLSDAHDAYYNVDKAKETFAKAKEELEAQGVQFPIRLDLPTNSSSKTLVSQAQSVKQSIETALGTENVIVDVQQLSEDELNNATYFATTAAQKDYDLTTDGWVPDYQDPSTYLDTLNTENGAHMQNFGFEPGQDHANISTVGLNTYTSLLNTANQENSDVASRYEKYAEAEAWLIDNGIIMPMNSAGGTPSLNRTVPFSRANSWIGAKGTVYNYKYLQLQNDIVTTKQYEDTRKKWQEEKTTSNEEAQKELANHVK
ncbi:Oligopeptide ABC transporter, periplasmic oligopeptide-binding protein OppA [Streptococcus sp. DD10]|uniref:peptide ABC transporter substrate-binding protein n=1 Tax=Streptococcus sp. DD10 TaxID=1777878 RepID=UPI000797C4E8|nr:peptide ABC transporter substrate-binding protein [Streptococcus sp. DD10]KXT72491.1 Oligopeptide ABC transporter, periplasmic oligopeptide-binding protein OppA [Streptococcus sp. DD10]